MPWSNATSAADVENPVDNVDNRLAPHELPNRGPALGIFAKQPQPGRVKTRLSPPLTPAEACAIYETALRETVARMTAGTATPVLCYAGRRAWFHRVFPGRALLPQGRGDLGVRLARATARLFAAGAAPVAVIGADSPDLPLALVEQAFAALADADAAVVPCLDGGFALLALRRPVPELFAGIPWSTAEVMAVLRQRAAALGLHVVTVAAWDDLDDQDSLRRLLVRSPECATARWVKAHLHSR